MTWQWTPTTILLSVTSVTLASASVYVLRRRRDHHVSVTGALLLLAGAVWALTDALEVSSTNLSTADLWLKFQYIAIVALPYLWFVYIIQFTGQEQWLTLRNLVLLGIIPLVTLGLAFTNEFHQLIWRQAEPILGEAFHTVEKSYSTGFWVFLTYSYLLVLVATRRLIRTLAHSRQLHRWQGSMLLLAVIAVLLASLVEVSHLNPIPQVDLTPLAMAVYGPVAAWSLNRLRREDIMPIAREEIIDSMSDSVIVLDAQDRIVDLNSAAQLLFSCSLQEAVGQPVQLIWLKWPEQAAKLHNDTASENEVIFGEGATKHIFDMRISPIRNWRGQLVSRVIVLRDVTKLKRNAAQVSTMLEASQAVSSTLEVENVLAHIAEQMGQAIDATSTYICDFNHVTKQVTVLAEHISPNACAEEQVSDFGVTYVEDSVEETAFIETLQNGHHDISHVDDPGLHEEEQTHMQRYGAKTILYIPLRFRGSLIGYVELWESRRRREFTPEEIALSHSIAHQAAVALENSRLFENERKQRQTAETLLSASSILSASLDLSDVLLTLARLLREISNFHYCAIYEWDPEAKVVRALAEQGRAVWAPGSEETYDLSEFPTSAKVLTSGEPAAIYADTNDPELAWMREQGSAALLMLPLQAGKETIGLVEFTSPDITFKFSQTTIEGVKKTLAEVAPRLSAPLRSNPEAELLGLARQLVEVSRASLCSISDWSQAEGKVRTVVEHCDLTWRPGAGPEHPMSTVTVTQAMEGSHSVIRVSDLDLDPLDTEDFARWGGCTTVYIPLRLKGAPLGLVELVDTAEERTPSDDDLRLWMVVADQAAIAIENAQLFNQVQGSLAEKEVLLKEIHHRVKNNLQVITSLLSLQAAHIEDQVVVELFQDSQNRVRSMALIHEMLYQSPDLARIDFAEYVSSLTNQLIQTNTTNGSPISLQTDIQDIWLNIDTAIPCGLIVNELVTNAFKHAFPNGATGEVRVGLHKEGDMLALTVADDGAGLPEGLDVRQIDTLGMQLVNTLVRQLDGEMELASKGGTAVTIRFKDPDVKKAEGST